MASAVAQRSVLRGIRRDTPRVVQGAFALWGLAVAAGIVESVLGVAGLIRDGAPFPAIVANVAVRALVYAAALFVAFRMLDGRPWARVALTLGLGVVGLASLVLAPLTQLVQGRSFDALLAELATHGTAFAASRAVHVVAVLAAVVLMFLPSANAYFRRARLTRG